MEKLTNEEILRQYKEETDKVRKELIFNEFYMKNEKFPYHIARKYLSSGHPVEDLASIARIGMMKAINKFDPTMGLNSLLLLG